MKITKVKDRNLYVTSIRKPDGKYKKVYGKTKKEVKEKAESLAFDIKSGKFVEDNKMTFSDWNKEWLENYLINVSDHTKVTYEGHVRNHINPYFKNAKIQSVTHHQIQSFINKLSNQLAPKTVRNIYLVIHRSLRDAKNNGYIAINPADDIILPKLKKKEMGVLDTEEIVAFLNSAYNSNSFYADAFEFLILTGLRLGEFIGLTFDSYNPITKELKIDKQYSRKLKKFIPPKHDVIRTIILPDRAHDIIMKHLRESQSFTKSVPGVNPNHNIFLNQNYGTINDGVIRKAFKKVANEIGMPDLRLHDLRHTNATLSLASGIDIKTISQNLGHSSEAFTLNKYAHSTKSMQKKASERLDEVFQKFPQNSHNY